MSATVKSKKSQIHPETSPSPRPKELGKFVPKSRVTENTRASRVADMISIFSTKPDMTQNRKITIKRTTSTGSDLSITPTSPVVRNPPRGPGVIRRHRSTGGNSGFRINQSNSPSDRNPQVANSLSKNDVLTRAREVSSDDDSSDDSSDSEVDEREPLSTRSLGRNEMRRIIPGSNLQGRPLAGKVINIPVNDKPPDPRIQRTVQNFKTSGRLPGGKVQTKGCVINPIGVTRPGGYSKGETPWKQSSLSPSTNTTSPKRSGSANANQHLHMTTSLERSLSPGGKSRIGSNPFFQNDRLKQSSSKSFTARDRVGSAPLLDTPSSSKPAREKNKSPEMAQLTSPRDSRSLSPCPSSPQLVRGNPSESLSVQSRIKMWATIEKERKEKQERVSPKVSPVLGRKVKSQSMKGEQSPRETEDELYDDVIPISTSHTETGQAIGDEVYDDVLLSSQKHNSPETAVVAEIEEAFYEDVEPPKRNRVKSAPPPNLRNISDDVYATIPGELYQNSCQANEDVPPTLPPRRGSLERSDQQSESQPHVYDLDDEEMYDDIESPKSSPSKANPKKGNLVFSLGRKMKNKEKNENSLSPKLVRSKWKIRSPMLSRRKKGKEDTKSESKDSVEGVEIRNLSNIGSRQSKKRVAVKRRSVPPSDAQPDGGGELETSMEVSVATENGVDDEVFDMKSHSDSIDSTDDKLSSSPPEGLDSPSYFTVTENQLDPNTEKFVSEVSARPVPKRSHATKDNTLSREIYDIINSMASSGPDDGAFSPLEEKAVAETSQRLLQSNCLSAPASNRLESPLLLITNSSSSPTSTPFHNGFSSPSSDDTNSARNSFTSDVDPEAMETNLDRPHIHRSAVRKQLSEGYYDPTKTIMSASLMEKYLSTSPTFLRKGSLTLEENSDCVATALMHADAVWNRVAMEPDELSFRVGEVIEILDMTDDQWWHGSVGDASGWFPSSFVRLRIAQDLDSDESPTKVDEGSETESMVGELPAITRNRPSSAVRRRMTIRRRDSTPSLPKKLTPSEVRAKVVEEILNTERDYIQHLEDIIEGYLKRCREYNKLFDEETVETIFANVEQIYNFQKDFLKELEARVDHSHMEASQIGEVFVLNRHEFGIYSEYCNNHPHAVNEMNSLQQSDQYILFFESCRLLRNLQDISLEGFLLTPVQKICKYPIQLSELRKYTSESHPDYRHVIAAQDTMKEVAMFINEHKRRMENIGKIGMWQETIDNWKGEDILERSTELLHSGELHKISKGHSQERHFFLFDHQLVYCKKDALGGRLSYKGRLELDKCQVTDMPDGTALHGGSAVKNSWRMHNELKDKWYVIYAKTLETKKQWMEAFHRERQRVVEDLETGYHVTLKMKRAAVALASLGAETRRRRRSFHKRHVLTESVDSGLRQRVEGSNTSPKKLVLSSSPQLSSAPGRRNKGNKRKQQQLPSSPVLPQKLN